MGLWQRLFARTEPGEEAAALYDAIVAGARAPGWYVDGGVPDTLDGRFDMVAAVTAFVLMRLEREPGAERLSVQLTERFVADMDAQVRQIGFGDMVVGKQIGRMVAMLGGRLGAYRTGLSDGTLDAALVRNLYRDQPPEPEQLAYTRDRLIALDTRLATVEREALAAGRLA